MSEQAAAKGLEAFLRLQGVGAQVAGWENLVGGRSAATVLVELVEATGSRRRVVLHLQGATGPLADRADVGRQFDVLAALEDSDVPAPRPLWWSRDPRFLGNPFLVTEYVPGDVPNPWRRAGREYLARERGGTLPGDFVAKLAAIHSVPLERLPAGWECPGSFASHELERWAAVVSRSQRFRHDPVLAYAERWLRSHLPAEEGRSLVHGDYRFGNLVVQAGRIVAVLDWELAEIGDPLFDLATACAPPLRARNPADDFIPVDQMLDLYAAASGRPVVRASFDFYVVLATFKVAALWINATLGDAGPSSLAALRAASSVVEVRPMLAAALGLTVPSRLASEGSSPLLTVARELEETVAPALTDPEARETLTHAVSVTRALARRAPEAAVRSRRRRLETFLRRHGVGRAVTEESADARLAAFIRSKPPPAAESGLRRLVGEAAQPEYTEWP